MMNYTNIMIHEADADVDDALCGRQSVSQVH